ncbi:hypothetical protein RGQ15_16765 [Paracoccus sp. MBLB3053]|uniref:Uncharacterized protein n=1 Tax=Paracoccus aurantius TaxID=3073814 RepID=A0ABU2HXG6_9RHOB|nr:hypothetical protein [Paracoccus sp. MBLB3053]MDS9469215.1 hypothetical protein [Paracoccus sp. MBLB3053]
MRNAEPLLECRPLGRMTIVLAVCTSLGGLWGGEAQARVSDCMDARDAVPGTGPGDVVFKLMLDELAGTASAGDAEIVHRALRTKLQDNFDKAQLELGRFHVVLCLGRSPLQVNDIMPGVRDFADHGVVIETWGFFDSEEATLDHALVPPLAEVSGIWPSSVKHLSMSYPYDGSGELSFLKSLVHSSPEIRMLAALGAASASYEAADYDNARAYFCRTLLMLRQYQDAASMRIDPVHRQVLDSFLEEMTTVRVIEEARAARAAGTYDGMLGSPIIPQGTTCEGVRP